MSCREAFATVPLLCFLTAVALLVIAAYGRSCSWRRARAREELHAELHERLQLANAKAQLDAARE